jgi:hypothetical protein
MFPPRIYPESLIRSLAKIAMSEPNTCRSKVRKNHGCPNLRRSILRTEDVRVAGVLWSLQHVVLPIISHWYISILL